MITLALSKGRILDEIIVPLRDNIVDSAELACLKAIVFFDPGIREIY